MTEPRQVEFGARKPGMLNSAVLRESPPFSFWNLESTEMRCLSFSYVRCLPLLSFGFELF